MTVKFDGVKISMGGADYIIPPLNLARIKKLRTELDLVQSFKGATTLTSEQIDTYVKILHSALTRNYPDMTLEQVEDMIDLGNLGPVFQAIMGTSGFVPGGVKPVDSPAP